MSRELRTRGARRHAHQEGCCSCRTIGIDTGKNALHLIGLDETGAKGFPQPDRGTACQHASVPDRHRGWNGDALHCARADCARSPGQAGASGLCQAVRDAYAVAEAVQRPTTRSVPVKTDGQLDLQALHRVRSRLIGERTAVINQIRCFFSNAAFLCDKGFAFFASSCPTSSRNAPTCSHRAWSGSSRTCSATGGVSTSASTTSRLNSKHWHEPTRAADD